MSNVKYIYLYCIPSYCTQTTLYVMYYCTTTVVYVFIWIAAFKLFFIDNDPGAKVNAFVK